MANESRGKVLNFVQKNYTGVAVVLVVIFMIIPVPKIMVDLLMILNLSASIIVLLSVISIPRASDFDTFPRIILILTMFGLGLNIASTRLILAGKVSKSMGGVNLESQSNMVQAFANIVTGDNIVVGFVIFIILIIVQVLVVTKGATRISEVAARFSLDSMSQKFFDVDNRLNSGVIDDVEAGRLKDAIRKEIDFYSTMDGASKFVSGNVKAGIVITVVNLLGGFIMGMVFNNLDFPTALQAYSRLTIGDGLLSQLPSMMVSFATGLLVTGTKSDEDFGEQIKNNFTRDGYIYEILGAVLVVMGIVLGWGTPSLMLLLIVVGIAFVAIGFRLSSNKQKAEAKAREEEAVAKATKKTGGGPDDLESIAMIDPLSLELGYALIPLVDKEKGAELLDRITKIRREANLDMGLIVPKIRIQDNMTLDPNEYIFKIHGIESGRATIKPGYYMCIDTGTVSEKIQGEHTKDPTFNMDAVWVSEDRRQEAEDAGYAVVDPPTIIATHLTEIIHANAADILGRQEVKAIIDKAEQSNPIVVKEVFDAKITYGQLEKIFKNLLEERVSIRNIVPILETVSNYASVTTNPWVLTEKVREALGLQIAMQYADKNRRIHLMSLSRELTELVMDHAYNPTDGSKPQVALDPVDRRRWLTCINNGLAKFQGMGYMPIILCASGARQLVHASIEREFPGVVVLSEAELYAAGNKVNIELLGEIAEEKEGEMGNV